VYAPLTRVELVELNRRGVGCSGVTRRAGVIDATQSPPAYIPIYAQYETRCYGGARAAAAQFEAHGGGAPIIRPSHRPGGHFDQSYTKICGRQGTDFVWWQPALVMLALVACSAAWLPMLAVAVVSKVCRRQCITEQPPTLPPAHTTTDHCCDTRVRAERAVVCEQPALAPPVDVHPEHALLVQ
jgi:hypothetical protein